MTVCGFNPLFEKREKLKRTHGGKLKLDPIIPIDLAVILVSAAFLGFLSQKLKQPTLVAYLLAGILIGPGVLGWADPTELIELMAELGLAFLLFLIGLKLDFSEVEHIFKPVTEISFSTMVAVVVSTIITGYLLGFSIFSAAVMGLAFMYSSTAVIVKLLKDSGGISKKYGEINTGILLLEDLTVVILMVLISSAGSSFLDQILSAFGFLIAAIIVTVVSTKTVLPKLLHEASEDSINLFVTGLGWLFLFVLASEHFGLGIEIGAFIAGLGLGQIEYSSELVEKMSPVTDFFIAMFFINFGLGLSLGEFLTFWPEALAFAGMLMVLKFTVISKLVKWKDYGKETAFKSGITMTQTSEFSLIFAAAASSAGLLNSAQVGLISLVAIITMGLSSYLILFHKEIFEKIYPGESELESDDSRENHALIAGYREGLDDIIELLGDSYSEVILVDRDPDVENKVENFEFGDFHHKDLREDLGLDKAGFVMVNFEDESLVREIVEESQGNCLILANFDDEIEGAKTYDSENMIAEELKRYLEER